MSDRHSIATPSPSVVLRAVEHFCPRVTLILCNISLEGGAYHHQVFMSCPQCILFGGGSLIPLDMRSGSATPWPSPIGPEGRINTATNIFFSIFLRVSPGDYSLHCPCRLLWNKETPSLLNPVSFQRKFKSVEFGNFNSGFMCLGNC